MPREVLHGSLDAAEVDRIGGQAEPVTAVLAVHERAPLVELGAPGHEGRSAQPQRRSPDALESAGPPKMGRPVADHLLLDNASAVFLLETFSLD